MDLRGLESIQWRGFSDREIQHYHSNIRKDSKTKTNLEVKQEENVSRTQHVAAPEEHGIDLNGQVDPLRDDLHCVVSKPQLSNDTHDRESKEVATPPPQDMPAETDLLQPQITMTLDEQVKQQKLMEEENKRKKTLIEQTLNDRVHQQQLEKQMLISVQMGLKELEQIVSKDVKILRDKIEETNRHYNSAKKRFDSAEKEYIAAKMELFKWSEQKELLSEHLCAVIQQNEQRKAAKLSELLKSLQLEDRSQLASELN